MAIIQISKIQQRSGNLVDLPQLDEAQFGWASDAKRLFIGKTTPNENIEVLTSYSNISFSQIDGSDGGNFNISGATNGQILTYVSTTNTWENWPSTDILNANANFKLDLGDVGNIKMTGGATGYVLETDGAGNVAWTSKGTVRTTIAALYDTTPVIMKVANTTPYTNGLPVTISGANAANADSIVNGQTFYVKVANNFPTTGNVELYTTPDLNSANGVVGTNLGTYTANSGISTALLTGGGTANAGGSVNTIQFNNSGILNGSANFTITGGNLVTLQGNFNASNINGNLVNANFVTGTLTTAAQPNITSVGTLTSLSASGNITGGNINGNGSGLSSITGANVTGTVANATYAVTTGTVTTAAQPNITSTGTLASLSVSGNANIGNIGTAGLIVATGNITGGNLTTAGVVSASGNASVLGIKTDNYYYANGVSISFAGSYSNSNVASYLPTYTGTVGATLLTTGANTTAGTITGNWSLSAGSRLTATYADLAEYYEADTEYEPGTVLEFGGEKEVTIAEDGTTRVAGVVSTDPAYAMNANCQGIAVAIALQGRVPTKVRGMIRKGDMMVSGGNGFARPSNAPQMGTVIGKALENFDGIEGVIEIAVGRL